MTVSSTSELKHRIREGKQIVGCAATVDFTKDRLQGIRDHQRCDFVAIDGQHTPLSEERIVAFCAMAAELDLFVLLRIKHPRLAFLAGNYLDLGPSGLEIPKIETTATVEEALQAFYYPPQGQRSYGGRYRRGGADREPFDYAEWWNSYGVLWLQVESVSAVLHAREFAQDGVDCLSIGPIDLSFSLKVECTYSFSSVDECVRHVISSIEGTGTRVCMRSTRDVREKYGDMGVTVFLERPMI